MVYVTKVPLYEDIWPELTALMTGQPWTDFYVYGISDFSQVIRTPYGHFCALYAYYIYTQSKGGTSGGLSIRIKNVVLPQMTYSGVLDDLYTKYGNPNSRRTKFPLIYSKAGFGLEAFYEWLAYTAPNITDADKEIYDWYPATTKATWNNKLGNPKTYPGWVLVMGQTYAPNQRKAFGPYINYVYRAGNKNAISQNILLKDKRTIIQDYAKYSSPPGYRSTPYLSVRSGAPVALINKISYSDWKKLPFTTTQAWRSIVGGLTNLPYFNVRNNADPMYFTFNSSGVKSIKRYTIVPYKTINYDIRYLDLLGDII
jgi:hypothetical protein